MKKHLVSQLFLVSSIACSAPAVDTKTEGDRIMKISRDWSKVAATGDIEKTLSYWADDAIVMSPGQEAIKGKQAIREMIESTSKIPGFTISWEPLSATVSKSGDLAYLIEKNQITMNDSLGNTIKEINKAVTVWRKEPDGSWKNIVDMWNALPQQQKIERER